MSTVGVAVSLIAVAGVLGCSGHGSSSTAVIGSAALSASPTTAAPATASAIPISAAPTSAKARTPGLDVDGDGAADSVTIHFLDKRRAVLEGHLGNGKAFTSKAFSLFKGEGAGAVSGFDVDGDRKTEVFVEAPGGDGIGYDLFQWVG